MSPVSRGRKRGKSRQTGPRTLRVVPPPPPDDCDCPDCLGADFDPQKVIDDLVAGGADLLTAEDPLDAELFAGLFLAAGDLAGDGFAEALAAGIVPAVAEKGSPAALAVLLALGALEDGSAATDAAAALAGSGVPAPAWAGELSEPVRVGTCRRFAATDDTASMLICTFERGGQAHGFALHVDHTDCHAAAGLVLFPLDAMPDLIGAVQANTHPAEDLDPAEFRWQVERALHARAAHDAELGPEALAEDDEPDMPGYHQLAPLLRARMRTLPTPPRPPAPHVDDREPPVLPRAATPKLPPKRKKSDGTAPVYQISVTLQGTEPPIWRRLELPGDTSLAKLHAILQLAFGWEDAHLHVFETTYGQFGIADRELGHRAEAPVTLEQVAGDALLYTYDFGDNWSHEIRVEEVLERGPGPYPRCTDGAGAAPPEDCGGVWGYADLLETLADPGHPDHADQLEWLGLDSAADFHPDRFDAAAVTRALTATT